MKVTANACANIALVKYWGKRDNSSLNVPQAGSLSVTLEALQTTTEIELTDSDVDTLLLDGLEVNDRALSRVSAHLDLFRRLQVWRCGVADGPGVSTCVLPSAFTIRN